MPQNKLPLYTVIPETEFNAIRATCGYHKGPRGVVISLPDNIVGLRLGGVYYAQQFGDREQANAKYKELKEKIRNGEPIL